MAVQMPLALGLKDSALFASFVVGDNATAVEFLERGYRADHKPRVYLWGVAGSGKSHLLQALCHAAGHRGEAAVYLPLRQATAFSCEVLNGLEDMAVVCLDDIDAIAGHRDWERALLSMMERVQARGCGLAVTAGVAAGTVKWRLPQLASRLNWELQFQLQAMAWRDRLKALQLRAGRRGLELSPAAARYLDRLAGADTGALFSTLDRLDRASAVAKRRLTIPFIRTILEAPR